MKSRPKQMKHRPQFEHSEDRQWTAAGSYLSGALENDGLYEGDSFDFLLGGSGANRLVVESEVPDRRYHVDRSDGTIRICDGGLIKNEYLSNHTPGEWVQEEIKRVDRAFECLPDAIGTTRPLKKADGDSMTFIRQGRKWYESSYVAVWNIEGSTCATDQVFEHPWRKRFEQHQLYIQPDMLADPFGKF